MHLGSTLCKILCIVLRYYVIVHGSSLVPHDKSLGTRLACTWFCKILCIQCSYCTSYWNRPYQLTLISQVLTVTSDTLPDLRASEVSCKHLLTKASKLQETSSAQMCVLYERYWENWTTSWYFWFTSTATLLVARKIYKRKSVDDVTN